MIDTQQTLNIDASPWKHILVGALGIGMAVVAGFLAFSGSAEPGSLAEFIGYVGLVFFGVLTALIFWRALTSNGPVVTIAPEGIRDMRVAAEFIPWTAIHDISTWALNGQKVMVLAVAPEVEKQLTLTRIARWTRSANAALKADGLCITAQGLKISHNELLEAAIAYMETAQAGAQGHAT